MRLSVSPKLPPPARGSDPTPQAQQIRDKLQEEYRSGFDGDPDDEPRHSERGELDARTFAAGLATAEPLWGVVK